MFAHIRFHKLRLNDYVNRSNYLMFKQKLSSKEALENLAKEFVGANSNAVTSLIVNALTAISY